VTLLARVLRRVAERRVAVEADAGIGVLVGFRGGIAEAVSGEAPVFARVVATSSASAVIGNTPAARPAKP
jgi:hypothetical protein